jgi:Fic family protein
MCTFINTNDPKNFIHPVIRGIILHFLTGYLHPFNDGNGRTARSLFYWYTLSQGYWFMEYLSISRIILTTKNQYALAYLYSEYDEMDVTYFIRYSIDCVNRSLNELIGCVDSMQESQRKAREIARSESGLTQRQAEFLVELMDHRNREYTVVQFSEKFAVSRETARMDLQFLESAGFISKIRRGKTLYFYADRNTVQKTGRNRSQ